MPIVPSPVDAVPIAYDVTEPADAAAAPRTLVLLHGSVLSRAIWRGLGYLEPLAAGHRVVRLDLRGHGRSGKPHDPRAYTQQVLAADVLAVLDRLGAQEPVGVIGYSLGARLALTLALEHPGRVARLVCLGGSAADQRGAVDSLFFPGTVDTLREEGMDAFCTRQGLGADAPGRTAQSTRTAFLRADPQAMAALFTATDATPGVAEERLSACAVPALWMTGERDVPRLTQSRHAAGLMPHGRFVPLPGRTHASTLSPARDVLDEVLPFLDGPWPGAPGAAQTSEISRPSSAER
ncbi:alpha/beta fold hydrolase [Brachybacterium phenoliresistens]|uniref:alpha/beta fold hydrolase n=1 Tax=Brachybacterium phenoliresistens TaxID=396014 RepID=UPI0031D7E4E4